MLGARASNKVAARTRAGGSIRDHVPPQVRREGTHCLTCPTANDGDDDLGGHGSEDAPTT
jgi:hypothetical protein